MTTPDPRRRSQTFEALLEFARAEQAGQAEELTVTMGPYTAFTLIGLLQLVWRHPDLSPQMRQVIEKIARLLQGRFGTDIQAEIELGWNTACDVPPRGHQ